MLYTIVLNGLLIVFSPALLQSPSRPGWDVLIRESDAIVIGSIESRVWVVRPDKMTSTTKNLPNGKTVAELPNPADYVVGTIYRVRVNEIVKKNRNIRAAGWINIFVTGRSAMEGEASFVEKQKYLIFLSPLQQDNEKFSGTMIYNPANPSARQVRFNPQSSYTVVRRGNGVVEITGKNLRLINEVKAAVHTNK